MHFRSALAVTILLTMNAGAGAFCSEPSAPYCASQYGNFDDQHEFEQCRNEMESYKSDVEAFMSCLKRKGDDAVGEYEDAVSSFNQRAGS